MTHPVNPLSFLKSLPALLLLLLPAVAVTQVHDTLPSSQMLKKLTLEELMDIEVMSVSKRPERLTEVPSAIQVITQKDIRHSGAKTLAEALRLASNLQAAQTNASQWAISARGFNNVLANKLLVLIDGRTVYTPLYAGVFWDVQNIMLENVDRIEVISGPGGTLWGANAVNGVINVITKNAKDTKGLLAEGAAGSGLPGQGSLRYGGNLAKNISYRVYATGFKLGPSIDTNDMKVKDDWWTLQGGSRIDWDISSKNQLSLQQNIYYARPNPDAGDTTAIIARGDNILARWNHQLSKKSNFQLQVYYDHTWRDFRNGFTEDLKTYDIEWQNKFQVNQQNIFTYGMNFRMMDHNVNNLELFAFLPAHQRLYLYSLFLQDEILMMQDRLRLTVGMKIEHNTYTDFQYQPNARLAWSAAKNSTIWAAVSRAVRNPARIDRSFFLSLTPDLPVLAGSNNFVSENVIAYEAGWRLQPREDISVSLATFYNVYDDIRSAEPGPPPFYIPITIANGVEGKTYGLEISANYQMTGWWNLRGGYTFLKKELSVKPGSQDLNKGSAESNDPMHQFLIQSAMDITKKLELGAVLRYIGKLPQPPVPSYTGIDLRIGWKLNENIELSVAGQNLLNKHHLEFTPSDATKRREIERVIYGKIVCRL